MLRELLAADVFKLMLIFVRIGSALMLMPALGSANVMVRARLLLALSLAFLLLPVLGPQIPPMPASTVELFLLVGGEAAVGIFFGLLLQTLMSSLDIAGNYIGYSVGLTNAFVFDANVEQQSQILSNFLSLIGVTLVLLTDSHHLMIRGLIGTYDLFAPGRGLPFEDLSNVFLRTLGGAFRLGMELAAPLVVFSLTFNTALGLINRLVPQMQVFFVAMPLQILGGLFLLGICMSPIMLWFLQSLNGDVGAFIGAR